MDVVTVTPIYGYVKHAALLTPDLQKWIDESPDTHSPWLGYAHNLMIRTLCETYPKTRKAVYDEPFESLKNEPWKPPYEKRYYNTVCAKCQRILQKMNHKEAQDELSGEV